MKRTIVLIVAAFAMGVASATTTWYVNAAKYGSSGSGKTSSSPFGTIQEAVNAASSGDTIKVAPGVYNQGVTSDGFMNSRIVIRSKVLKIESTGSRDDTFIVGAHGTSTYEFGADAVRCCFVSNSVGTTIRGFTLRDGSVKSDVGNASGQGGGVFVCDGVGSGCYLIDCAVLNCRARGGGGMHGGGAIRTLFAGNVRSGSGSNGAIVRGSVLWNCICVNNDFNGQPGCQSGQIFNCTIIGNGQTGNVVSETSRLVNCVSVMNSIDNAASSNIATADAEMNDLRYSVCSGRAYYGIAKTLAKRSDATVGLVTNAPAWQLFAPATGDFRPIEGSLAATGGNADAMAAYATTFGIPEAEIYKDFNGKAIPTTGVIASGAVQTIAPKPTSGAVAFESGSFLTCGFPGKVTGLYAYPTNYPAMMSFSTNCFNIGAKQVFCYWVDTIDTQNWRAPMMDETLCVLPPPDPSTHLTNGVIFSTAVYYVDRTSGSDYNSGLSKAAAVKSISKAMTKLSTTSGNRQVVRVGEGEYNAAIEGATAGVSWTNRVVVPSGVYVRIVGAGRDTTSIVGAADDSVGESENPGCGPKAVRCIAGESGSCFILQGFTLRDGHVANKSASGGVSERYSGAAAYLSSSFSWLADCKVTASKCNRAFCYGGSYSRTVFDDCYGWNGGLRGIRALTSCAFKNCPGSGAGAVIYNDGTVKAICHVTAVTPTQATNPFSFSNLPVWNCVFANGNSTGADSIFAVETNDFGTIVWNFATMPKCHCFTYVDPELVSTTDLRPYAASPVFSSGAVLEERMRPREYCRWATADVEGRPLAFDEEGHPASGCYQRGVTKVEVVQPATGTITPSGSVPVEDGEAVSIVYTEDETHKGKRPFDGIAVNGVKVTGGSTWQIVAPSAKLSPVRYVVEPLTSTNWYVNAVSGNDSNTGWSPTSARRTFAGIMQCDILAGDCIHAAAGDYEDGYSLHPTLSGAEQGITSNRLVMVSGTTVVADEGPSVTFIRGQQGYPANQYGRGPGAIRCVYMPVDTVLKGFTLVDGNTAYIGETKTSDPDNADSSGGGVYCAQRERCWVYDCIITNCAANRSGGGHTGSFVHCRFYDNASIGASQGDVASSSDFYGCYVGRHRSSNSTKGLFRTVNCTFENVTVGQIPSTASITTMRNNVYLGSEMRIASTGSSAEACVPFENCVFEDLPAITNGCGQFAQYVSCKFANATSLRFDAQGVPVYGANAAVDAGDSSFVPECLDGVDLNGSQRVYNGAVDAGATEYDYRGVFSRRLGFSGTAVTYASPDVLLRDSSVRVSAGAALLLDTSAISGGSMKFTVTNGGGGTSVLKDGVEVAAVYPQTSPKEFDLTAGASVGFETWNYTGAYADIGAFDMSRGIYLIFH